MPKSLKGMSDKKKAEAKQRKPDEETRAGAGASGGARPVFPQGADLAELMGKYGGKSESELMSALLEATAEQKRAGSFDSARMDAMAASILPMLNPEQAQRLQSILERIK